LAEKDDEGISDAFYRGVEEDDPSCSEEEDQGAQAKLSIGPNISSQKKRQNYN